MKLIDNAPITNMLQVEIFPDDLATMIDELMFDYATMAFRAYSGDIQPDGAAVADRLYYLKMLSDTLKKTEYR